MLFCLRLNFLLFFFFSSTDPSFQQKVVENGSFTNSFFSPSCLFFEGFWYLHSLKKRLEIWQRCIPAGDQHGFGQLVSHWKAWLGMPGGALQGPAAGVPICKGTLATLCPPIPFSRDTSLSHRSGVVAEGAVSQ